MSYQGPRTWQPPLTDAQWLAHSEVARLVAGARTEAYAEIADRLASWEFPAGSDALAPITLLVADLRRRAEVTAP